MLLPAICLNNGPKLQNAEHRWTTSVDHSVAVRTDDGQIAKTCPVTRCEVRNGYCMVAFRKAFAKLAVYLDEIKLTRFAA